MLVTFNSCAQMKVESPAFNAAIEGIVPKKIELISVNQLRDSFDIDNVVLLDAREKNEFDISHLQGAIWVGYNDFNMNRLKGIDKGKTIVVYCSVGYRSGVVGEKIENAGFESVYNLYGGIFEWVNTGGLITDKTGETPKIHGYDAKWAAFVKKGEVVLTN